MSEKDSGTDKGNSQFEKKIDWSDRDGRVENRDIRFQTPPPPPKKTDDSSEKK